MSTATEAIDEFVAKEYNAGFITEIEMETLPRGLTEEIVRLISAKKDEPEWLLEWRLKAYRHWLTMPEPDWHNVHYPKIEFQNIIYYAAPKQKITLNSLDEVDPELLATFAKLNMNVFQPKCVSCHSDAKASGGYSMSSYAGVMTRVTAGDLTSPLILRTASGAMPIGGSLTIDQKAAIVEWITLDAQNPHFMRLPIPNDFCSVVVKHLTTRVAKGRFTSRAFGQR